MNTLLVMSLGRISRMRSVNTQLIAKSNAPQTQVLSSEGECLCFRVNNGFFTGIGSHITNEVTNVGRNILVDSMKTLGNQTTFFVNVTVNYKSP